MLGTTGKSAHLLLQESKKDNKREMDGRGISLVYEFEKRRFRGKVVGGY